MTEIAVLIPSYQPGDYIFKCFESLEKQTIGKGSFKVYVCLNGPQYPYEEFILNLLCQFNFEYKFLYSETKGVSIARNKLIESSTEEYMVFLDDDDLVSPSYLEELIKASSQKVMGISNIFNFELGLDCLKPNYIGEAFKKLNACETSKFKSRKYFSSPCAKMLNRKMIGNVRFDPNVAKGEDSLFMALISPNIEAVNKTTSQACYYVYERIGSATRKQIKKRSEIKTLSYLFTQYLKLFFDSKYEKLFIMTRLLATALKFLKLGIGSK